MGRPVSAAEESQGPGAPDDIQPSDARLTTEAIDLTTTLTIVIHLPQSLDKVVTLLRALGDEWPHVTLNTTGPWLIEIPAEP